MSIQLRSLTEKEARSLIADDNGFEAFAQPTVPYVGDGGAIISQGRRLKNPRIDRTDQWVKQTERFYDWICEHDQELGSLNV